VAEQTAITEGMSRDFATSGVAAWKPATGSLHWICPGRLEGPAPKLTKECKAFNQSVAVFEAQLQQTMQAAPGQHRTAAPIELSCPQSDPPEGQIAAAPFTSWPGAARARITADVFDVMAAVEWSFVAAVLLCAVFGSTGANC